MSELGEAPPGTHEISQEEYFTRLPEVDRDNLKTVNSLFKTIATEEGLEGGLVAVGGSITKPFPRKDIDIKVVFEGQNYDPKNKLQTYYDYSLKDYRNLETVVRKMAEKDQTIKIVEEIEPVVDEEYGNPNILRHDGGITIQRGNGTKIELIRDPRKGAIDEMFSGDRLPWVLLTAA